ncbi:MAG: hypothetical protein JO097_13985 [Acidobacteriaceae bacterium]|nr:hypothetical protein [Acidobacteriaceae bacterium]MBV9294947.1 hypothetical protein [Acidobacteriaceae bacterium]MBV9763951.1 hypothetical protein [Acidobacteriaceae bacterium]
MNAAIITAMISTSGAVVIGITALVLNYRGFVSIERRLEILEGDLKEFFRH